MSTPRTLWLVIKHDAGVTLRERSFWILALIMPVLLTAFNAFTIINVKSEATETGDEAGGPAEPVEMPQVGLVDEVGLIQELPPGFPPDLLKSFDNLDGARTALEDDQVEQILVIPADYLSSGEVSVYDRNFQIIVDGDGASFDITSEALVAYLINSNLTGDHQLALAIRDPLPLALSGMHRIAPEVEGEADDKALAELVASITPYIYYFLLLLGSSYLMRSVVAEKENRTVEVLLLSVGTRRLMLGKILAMSLVIFIQLFIWLGSGILILDRGAALMQVSGYSFPPGFFIWALLFLLLGYLLFASVMAAAGAMANSAREGGQMTWLLIIPLMPTLMFGRLFIEEPDNFFTIFLSLFPFSSPSAMVTRLAVGSVPLWQLLISLGLLAITTYIFVVLAARYFRAGNLLSSTSFSLRRLAAGWRR